MKKLLLLALLATAAGSASAQTRVRGRSNAGMSRAQVDTLQYTAPDSSQTDRGSGFESTPGLSPRTERSDPDAQADQKSNTTDPQNRTYNNEPTPAEQKAMRRAQKRAAKQKQ